MEIKILRSRQQKEECRISYNKTKCSDLLVVKMMSFPFPPFSNFGMALTYVDNIELSLSPLNNFQYILEERKSYRIKNKSGSSIGKTWVFNDFIRIIDL